MSSEPPLVVVPPLAFHSQATMLSLSPFKELVTLTAPKVNPFESKETNSVPALAVCSAPFVLETKCFVTPLELSIRLWSAAVFLLFHQPQSACKFEFPFKVIDCDPLFPVYVVV